MKIHGREDSFPYMCFTWFYCVELRWNQFNHDEDERERESNVWFPGKFERIPLITFRHVSSKTLQRKIETLTWIGEKNFMKKYLLVYIVKVMCICWTRWKEGNLLDRELRPHLLKFIKLIWNLCVIILIKGFNLW